MTGCNMYFWFVLSILRISSRSTFLEPGDVITVFPFPFANVDFWGFWNVLFFRPYFL